jgi:hypothetical protein
MHDKFNTLVGLMHSCAILNQAITKPIAYSYFLNQAKIFSTLPTKREGLLAMP